MALDSIKHEGASSTTPDQVDRQQVPNGSSDDRAKRHPRWTRHETVVLIEGKKVVENAVQKGRSRSSSALVSDHFEPKWDLVSSYCKQRGVSREPVQCRKRWSNLLVDFKKIRNWESQIKGAAESFWVMRNDVRKERKLPGFFDREVYNILDGNAVTATAACPLALFIPVQTDAQSGDGAEEAAAEEEEEEQPGKAANGLQQDMAEDGLSSDSEESETESKKENLMQDSPATTVTTPMPSSEAPHMNAKDISKWVVLEAPTLGTTLGTNSLIEVDAGSSSIREHKKEKRGLDSNTCGEHISQEKRKLRRLAIDRCEDNYSDQLIRVLERNNALLNAQLEARNINCHLDREQRKEQSNSLLAAISKVTDALVRIADKL
ncbi:trihelix transcription factor ASR3 [Prunus yedoensis var. nudiflora]|uniref:Trihelix transcription factor ASR3 n=1 Tax=Prunus yedoensis var. nudiflora TaxID=2094558 RepID=A0A314ZMP9_PRUYE|nr:trihelix transcription factor ASR3 [Prunus yedoensis var. nudiflora]